MFFEAERPEMAGVPAGAVRGVEEIPEEEQRADPLETRDGQYAAEREQPQDEQAEKVGRQNPEDAARVKRFEADGLRGFVFAREIVANEKAAEHEEEIDTLAAVKAVGRKSCVGKVSGGIEQEIRRMGRHHTQNGHSAPAVEGGNILGASFHANG